MEHIEAIVAIATAIIALIKAITDLFGKRNRNREKKYYNCLLKPYVMLKKDRKVKTIEFVKKRARRDNDNIPKYVFYLMDNENEEELEKVLIYDYISLYPCAANYLNTIAGLFIRILLYLCFAYAIFAILSGIVILSLGMTAWFLGVVSSLYSEGVKAALKELILWKNISGVLYSVFYLLGGVFLLKICIKNELDRYTLDLKKIKNKIKTKIKNYDKEKHWI